MAAPLEIVNSSAQNGIKAESSCADLQNGVSEVSTTCVAYIFFCIYFAYLTIDILKN